MEWMPIESAPKDGTAVLLLLKPREGWSDLRMVAAHPGLAADGFDVGWCFAAPVGYGGISDVSIAGWLPLPNVSLEIEGQ